MNVYENKNVTEKYPTNAQVFNNHEKVYFDQGKKTCFSEQQFKS